MSFTGAGREQGTEAILTTLDELGYAGELEGVLLGDFRDVLDDLDEDALSAINTVLDYWTFVDASSSHGTLIESLLRKWNIDLPECHAYFRALAKSSLRLYEVIDTSPGESLRVRAMVGGEGEITVFDRSASRSLARYDHVALRLTDGGPSGQAEIEPGVLNFPRLVLPRLIPALEEAWTEFEEESQLSDTKRWRELTPVLCQAWLASQRGDFMPELRSSEGEPIAPTKTVFRVMDRARVEAALDSCPELMRASPPSGPATWRWSEGTADPALPLRSLGQWVLRMDRLTVETMTASRGERAQRLASEILGDAVVFRATLHEDLGSAASELEPASPPGNGPEVAEQLEVIAQEHHQHYYRKWLDEPVPRLEDHTPRQAAAIPRLRGELISILKELENMYWHALGGGAQTAFDPWWLWEELEVAAPYEPRGSTLPPPLMHESMQRLLPGFERAVGEAAAEARRRPGFDDQKVLEAAELERALPAERLVRRVVRPLRESGASMSEANEAAAPLRRLLLLGANFELHRRKTFWVDRGLVLMLAKTAASVDGSLLRVPFASFALVFTDRWFLGRGERLLAQHPSAEEEDRGGQRLRVCTVLVSELGSTESGRTLDVAFAFDALGADWPIVVERTLVVDDGRTIEQILDRAKAPPLLRELLEVVVNSILYATSAEVKIETRAPVAPPSARHGSKGSSSKLKESSAENVHFLPSPIDLVAVRRIQALERAPSGRSALHRFMVRGHWRRAPDGWTDRRLRWIEPYWKGPDMAALIERCYRLRPGEELPEVLS